MVLAHDFEAPAVLQDLTELERFRLALIGAGEAVFDWTPADDFIVWSDNAADVLGVAEPPRTGGRFRACLQGDAAEDRRREIERSARRGRSYRAEYRFHAAGGNILWLEERGVCLYDGEGEPSRVVGVVRDVTERKAWESRLTYLASYDELTGHLNRTRLQERLAGTIDEARRQGAQGAYLAAAIDDLAVINETHGFDVADEVILAAGRRLAAVLGPQDVIGRTAGNKFGVVLNGCDAAQVRRAADRLLKAARENVITTGAGGVCATVSIGAVLLPGDMVTAQEAMVRAEHALDAAKRAGRDRFILYSHSPERESNRKRNLAIADQMTSALDDGRMFLAYQPIVCARTRRVAQYECLLRLKRPNGELMPAAEFIPVAEQTGLVRVLDRHALQLAIKELKARPDLHLALNVSAITATDPAWLSTFLNGIDPDGAVARRLTLELTETLAMEDIEQSRRFVSRLRDLGCRVAIDDFGAGYTSFKNLQLLDIDLVKIDGSFVKGICGNRDNQLFVRMLVDLARNFGLRSVAEWVEEEEEVDMLRDMGVDYVQGFYLGRPGELPTNDAQAPEVTG